MKDVAEEIVDYLTRNRVSTTEVADCLEKTGALKDIMPCNYGHYKAGIISLVYAYDESNWPVHEQIQSIEDNRIVVVEAYNCNNRAIFGELVSKYVLLYHQSKAIVVNGKMRDAAALIREKWPIWCSGYTPIGCFNTKPQNEVNHEWLKCQYDRYEGAIAVCDDCGVVIIPKNKITLEFLDKLHNIENQEDIWFDRLDHYKESTFDIVCNKKYLKDDYYMSIRENNRWR